MRAGDREQAGAGIGGERGEGGRVRDLAEVAGEEVLADDAQLVGMVEGRELMKVGHVVDVDVIPEETLAALLQLGQAVHVRGDEDVDDRAAGEVRVAGVDELGERAHRRGIHFGKVDRGLERLAESGEHGAKLGRPGREDSFVSANFSIPALKDDVGEFLILREQR